MLRLSSFILLRNLYKHPLMTFVVIFFFPHNTEKKLWNHFRFSIFCIAWVRGKKLIKVFFFIFISFIDIFLEHNMTLHLLTVVISYHFSSGGYCNFFKNYLELLTCFHRVKMSWKKISIQPTQKNFEHMLVTASFFHTMAVYCTTLTASFEQHWTFVSEVDHHLLQSSIIKIWRRRNSLIFWRNY